MNCEKCKFWERRKDEKDFGFCKRFPPSPAVTAVATGLEFQIVWPSTGKDDNCGEFSQRYPG